MMHLTKDGMWTIECDDCDETLETEEKDKEDAIQMAMNSGWHIEGKWHYCEQCAEDHDDEK